MNLDPRRKWQGHIEPVETAAGAIKLGGALLLAGILGWRVIVVGVADYYASQAAPETAIGALRWRGDHPVALYQRGLAAGAGEPATAERSFQAAAWANPTDALVYLALAEVWARSSRRAEAVGLVEIADVLGPLRSPALARSAEFWFGQLRPDRALARWAMLLRTRPEAAAQLFPLLLRLAEDSTTQRLLQPLLADPPEWWDEFFAHAVTKAARVETVIFLYQQRNRGKALPAAGEQRVFLDRLWQEERWPEAYLTWLNGLDERQQLGLGNLYNGSFELPVTGVGFDWRISSPRGALVEITETYGTRGGKALHVVFDGQRVHFQHVQQPLYLGSGAYRLQGRVRPDGLRAERGLRWAVRCAGSDARLLTESDSFVGTNDWQVFATNFTVPDAGCPAQVLRLELQGRAELDFEAQGAIWFDDLTIIRQG